MNEHDQQAEHARLFGETSRPLIASAFAFAEGVKGTFSRFDVARMFLAPAVLLASAEVGRAGAVAMLRDCADALERGEDLVKPN